MTVCFIADVHVGNHRRCGGDVEAGLNARCRDTLMVLRDAVGVAKKHSATLMVLGDLFDKRRPDPQAIAAVQRILEDAPCALLRGNHETVSTVPGDHALGPMLPICTVVDQPTILDANDGDELWCVPHTPGDVDDWLEDTLVDLRKQAAPTDEGHRRILCLHMGIKSKDTPPWLKQSTGAIDVNVLAGLCEKYGIQHVYAGDWHDRQQWRRKGVRITQVGTLVPTGWNNPGLDGYGAVDILPTEGKPEHTILPGPRFLAFKGGKDTIDRVLQETVGQPRLYLQVAAKPSDMSEVQEHLAMIRANGSIIEFEVVPDADVAKAKADKAAEDTSNAEGIGAKVEAFANAMTLPDGVEREEVLQRSRDYLTAAISTEGL